MTFTRTLATAATGLALALAPLTPAVAQQDAPTEAPAAIEPESVTEEQLDLFATAVLDVSAVANEYRPQIESETDNAAREALVAEANEAMLAAVRAIEGLSVEEYLAIGQAARSDEALNTRVTEKLQEMSDQG